MGELVVEQKSIVVPGEVIAQGMDFVPTKGTYRLGDDIVASMLGLLQVEGKVIKLIPLSGRYLPKRGDVIVGKVTDITMSGWIINTNSPYPAMLGLKDATAGFIRKGENLSQYFKVGDVMVMKIFNVTGQNLVDLTLKGPGLRKLDGGRLFNVNSKKVPRIIGKMGSMVSLIKEATGCNIVVGQNGVVWMNGTPESEMLAETTIRKIEEESHIPGLTERIKVFLEQKTGKTLTIVIPEVQENTEQDSGFQPRYEQRDRPGFRPGGFRQGGFRPHGGGYQGGGGFQRDNRGFQGHQNNQNNQSPPHPEPHHENPDQHNNNNEAPEESAPEQNEQYNEEQ